MTEENKNKREGLSKEFNNNGPGLIGCQSIVVNEQGIANDVGFYFR